MKNQFNVETERANFIVLMIIDRVDLDLSKSIEDNLVKTIEKLNIQESNEIIMLYELFKWTFLRALTFKECICKN
jgi:hypothetical protein